MPTPRGKMSLFGLHSKKKSKPTLFFAHVGHAIKKPKPHKSPSPVEKKESPSEKRKHIRQAVKEKFDFSRTPYATSKRARVVLEEADSKKRKFFKSTVVVPETKKPRMDQSLSIEFDDYEDLEREKINKSVDSFLKEWNLDSEFTGPEITRQKANELESTSTLSHFSYLLPPTNLSPAAHNNPTPTRQFEGYIPAFPNTPPAKETNKNSLLCYTPTNQNLDENSPLFKTPTTEDDNSSSKKAFYPIFTTPTTKKVLKDVTNKKNRLKLSLMKAAAPNDQYQIDAGQVQIGPTECHVCGMVYDIGDAVDEKRHNMFHERRFELKYKVSKNDNIAGYVGADRIISIEYSDDKKREKVEEILKMTEEEIGSGYTFGPSSMAYIYIQNDQILGCLIAEPKVKASPRWESGGIVLVSDEEKIVKCGVNRIWVKKDFRGKKIATELMNCLRKNFIYGEYLQIDDVAFSTTTIDGHKFARRYTGKDDYLTYIEPSSH